MTGAGALTRLALRRDRVLLPIWTLVFVATAAGSAVATVDLYPTVASRVAAATSVNNTPSLVALYGRIHDPTSLGEIAMMKLSSVGAALVAVVAMMTVVRHTRAEEEVGRRELLGATAIARSATLTAALIVAVVASVLVGGLTALGLAVAGLPASGALAFGLAWAATGITFAAVAAVAAQVARSARAANGVAGSVLGIGYLLRAIGDTSHGALRWVAWISPTGWGQLVRPFAGARWSVLVLMLAFAAVVTGLAYALDARRDLGAGLVPDHPGRGNAAASLAGPFGLAWRLNRGVLAGWLAAFVVLGLILGSIGSDVESLLASPQAQAMIRELGGQKDLSHAFLAAEIAMIGMISSVFAVQAATRLRSEELGLRAEPVLASAVGRVRWAAGFLAVAVSGAGILLATAGTTIGITYAVTTRDVAGSASVLTAALVHLPATWVLAGIVLAGYGFDARLTAVGWAALVAFLVVGEFGPMLQLPQPVMDLSPFAHVPRLPGDEFAVAPLLWLTLIAVGLVTLGLVALRRRDLG